jgi:ring-1,2-phenylacetyl-CoA epoxidase subunit PaaD
MTVTENISAKAIWRLMKEIPDPEIPVLSIIDLGIVRDIKMDDENIEIIITPTYSGCPAMDMIQMNIRMSLLSQGCQNIKITTVLSPAWTTDWMNEEAKQKLKNYGIASPQKRNAEVKCPLCNSLDTKLISQFGSTACKALYQCNDCKEPFDYFKCH